MEEEDQGVQVNFGRPMPLFPLDHVALLPQQVLPLHIFEPRYRQMVNETLDGAGQIAMAVFKGERWRTDYHGRPPLMPAVCLGHIVQHEQLDDDRYNILVQGICRARIADELGPDTERLYRAAMLEPIDAEPEQEELQPIRERIETMLDDGELSRLASAETLLEYIRNEELPSHALMEVVAFVLVTGNRARYRLLAEGDPSRRASIVMGELDHLTSLLSRATRQNPEAWPKGLSWN